jgi:hypothetical protein
MTTLMIFDSSYGHLEFFEDSRKGLKSAKKRYRELVTFFKSQAPKDDPNRWLDELRIERVEIGKGKNYWYDSRGIIYSYDDYINDEEIEGNESVNSEIEENARKRRRIDN